MKKKIGLFPGSFNPVHLGHLIVADSALREFPLDEIWFVISPQNPFKVEQHLLSEDQRYNMLAFSIEDNEKFLVSSIEFDMPKPSYTSDTLKKFTEIFPDFEFFLLMGTDILDQLPKWKNYEYIINNFKLLLYERNNIHIPEFLKNKLNYEFIIAPQIGISSTQIREYIKTGVNYRYYLPEVVYNYIKLHKLYKND